MEDFPDFFSLSFSCCFLIFFFFIIHVILLYVSSCLFTTECKYSFLCGADLTIKFSFQISRIIVSFGSLHMHKMIAMNFLLFFLSIFNNPNGMKSNIKIVNSILQWWNAASSCLLVICLLYYWHLSFVVTCALLLYVCIWWKYFDKNGFRPIRRI